MTVFLRAHVVDGDGTRVAVKDVIDVEGAPTTGCCEAVAQTALPAERDAACIETLRGAGGRIVGRTVCDELAIGARGVNTWSGWPLNPLDPELIPGGSSSGSAVAVATGAAEVGIGSDTGGSCRIPAACCGIFGLKTTHGRVPLDGVLPLSPSLDTIGPLAADVPALVRATRLLIPSLRSGTPASRRRVGRLRVPDVDGRVDAGVDATLARTGWEIVDVEFDGWSAAQDAATTLLLAEAGEHHGHLLDGQAELLTPSTEAKLRVAQQIDAEAIDLAHRTARRWRTELDHVFGRVDLIALPTLPGPPPRLDDPEPSVEVEASRLCLAFNLAGVPALALPTPAMVGHVPISLQLVAPWDGETVLLSSAAEVCD